MRLVVVQKHPIRRGVQVYSVRGVRRVKRSVLKLEERARVEQEKLQVLRHLSQLLVEYDLVVVRHAEL